MGHTSVECTLYTVHCTIQYSTTPGEKIIAFCTFAVYEDESQSVITLKDVVLRCMFLSSAQVEVEEGRGGMGEVAWERWHWRGGMGEVAWERRWHGRGGMGELAWERGEGQWQTYVF